MPVYSIVKKLLYLFVSFYILFFGCESQSLSHIWHGVGGDISYYLMQGGLPEYRILNFAFRMNWTFSPFAAEYFYINMNSYIFMLFFELHYTIGVFFFFAQFFSMFDQREDFQVNCYIHLTNVYNVFHWLILSISLLSSIIKYFRFNIIVLFLQALIHFNGEGCLKIMIQTLCVFIFIEVSLI